MAIDLTADWCLRLSLAFLLQRRAELVRGKCHFDPQDYKGIGKSLNGVFNIISIIIIIVQVICMLAALFAVLISAFLMVEKATRMSLGK